MSAATVADVTAVVVTHAAPPETLTACLRSLAGQDHPVAILLVDNSLGADRAVVAEVCRAFPSVTHVAAGENLGFARAVNRALARVATPFVLVINDDATLEPEATTAMREALVADPEAVAAAPKVRLTRHPHLLEGVGSVIRPDGLAFNRGIGQLDVAQYDAAGPVFGASFAACLVRRQAFEPDAVGPLDPTFFMYYEDVDWCYRAGLLGWRVLATPRARGHHEHASTAGRLDGFRHRFLYRNPLWLVVRNFEAPRARRALGRRLAAVASRMLRGPNRYGAARALRDFGRGLPRQLAQRRLIQSRRAVGDAALLAHASGEVSCFDHERLEPRTDFATLAASYERRSRGSREPRDRRIAELARQLGADASRPDLRRELLGLVSGEPEPVRAFVAALLHV